MEQKLKALSELQQKELALIQEIQDLKVSEASETEAETEDDDMPPGKYYQYKAIKTFVWIDQGKSFNNNLKTRQINLFFVFVISSSHKIFHIKFKTIKLWAYSPSFHVFAVFA